VPIYEYQCKKCGEIFEAFQKYDDDPLKQCKFCRGRVEKLISHSSFQLKGGGWYLTDYAKKSGCSLDSNTKKTDSCAKSGESTAPAPAIKSEKGSEKGSD
jgi:putative FmdB family regulatory protein